MVLVVLMVLCFLWFSTCSCDSRGSCGSRGVPVLVVGYPLALVARSPQLAGLEIATNMVANATNFFSLVTKIFV